jgi:hypothetical protein
MNVGCTALLHSHNGPPLPEQREIQYITQEEWTVQCTCVLHVPYQWPHDITVPGHCVRSSVVQVVVYIKHSHEDHRSSTVNSHFLFQPQIKKNNSSPSHVTFVCTSWVWYVVPVVAL